MIKECLEVIFLDENTNEGINDALNQMHSYVPQHTTSGKTAFNKTGVVGDHRKSSKLHSITLQWVYTKQKIR